MLHTLLRVVAYKITKVKIVGCVASSLQVSSLVWKYEMEQGRKF